MIIEIISLCDAATDSQGKLNILGTFDTIWTRQVPMVYPQCAVAMRIRFTRIEEGEHRLKINILNEDGKLAMPSLDATIKVVFSHESDSAVTNLILNIQQLKLEKHGQYAIDVAINGRQEASLPLFVREALSPV
jgi:hypothetical protein